MHVLHIIDTLGLGGAERMLVDIANATVRDGHDVSVCVTRSDTTLGRELDRSIEVLVLDRRRRFSIAAFRRLSRWTRDHRIDVIHVHLRHTLALVLLLRTLGALRLPIVFHDHYGSIENDRSIPRWFHIGHRLIDRYVGVHDSLRDWAIEAGMPAAKTTTIANALDLSRLTTNERIDLRALLGVTATRPIGILVATLRPDKGIEVLIEALGRSRGPGRTHVAIVGATGDPRYFDECKSLVRVHGLEHAITFLGGRSDVPALLRGADFGVLTSHTESGPLVLIEYLAAGLPIVSTRVGNIGRHLAALGLEGFVPPGEPAGVAAALDELLDLSDADRRARGERGRVLLTQDSDIRQTMPRWYEVYHSVMQ